MEKKDQKLVSAAKETALKALLHNNRGPYHGLPRAAGWGYPALYSGFNDFFARRSRVRE